MPKRVQRQEDGRSRELDGWKARGNEHDRVKESEGVKSQREQHVGWSKLRIGEDGTLWEIKKTLF